MEICCRDVCEGAGRLSLVFVVTGGSRSPFCVDSRVLGAARAS